MSFVGLARRAAPLARRAAPLARRAAPVLVAGAAGAVLGRYIEARRRPQPALLPPVEERPPALAEAAEDVQDAEVVAEEEAVEADALEEEAEEPAERPITVDFKALAGHPALSHEPPPGDPPEVAVRAALTEVSVGHAASVSIQAVENLLHLPGTPPPLTSERG